jgi:very-short-patch-repair endonuclease
MDAPHRTRAFAKTLRRELSLPEVLLWQHLRRKAQGIKVRRQHPIGPYILDFFCPAAKLAIEVDGMVHDTGDHPKRDAERDAWLLRYGIATLRLPAYEILADMDAAVRSVLAQVDERALNVREADRS